MHEVAVDGLRLVMDCGLYQGRRQEAFERNRNLPWSPGKLDAVLLSHAHIDHSGNLPSLSRGGYEGPIHATPATADLCRTMLPDSAYLQEKDVEFIKKRRWRRRRLLDQENNHNALEPLYTQQDVEKLLPLFSHVDYGEQKPLSQELTFEMADAGHLLGSAWIRLNHRGNGRQLRLTFSGDIGRCCLPILRDPIPMPETDYLILESTYGNRLHKQDELVSEKLAEVVNRTAGRGGRIIIPAFAVGRTQQIVLILHELCERKAIPSIPIFVDSPQQVVRHG